MTIFLYWFVVIVVVFVAKAVSGVIAVEDKQFASVWLANRLLLGVAPPTVELKFLKIEFHLRIYLNTGQKRYENFENSIFEIFNTVIIVKISISTCFFQLEVKVRGWKKIIIIFILSDLFNSKSIIIQRDFQDTTWFYTIWQLTTISEFFWLWS